MKPVATFDPLLSLWNCDSYDTGGTLGSAPATLGEEFRKVRLRCGRQNSDDQR